MEQLPAGRRRLAGAEQQQAVATQSATAADSPHEQQPEHTPLPECVLVFGSAAELAAAAAASLQGCVLHFATCLHIKPAKGICPAYLAAFAAPTDQGYCTKVTQLHIL